jgi:hypothetical protein
MNTNITIQTAVNKKCEVRNNLQRYNIYPEPQKKSVQRLKVERHLAKDIYIYTHTNFSVILMAISLHSSQKENMP